MQKRHLLFYGLLLSLWLLASPAWAGYTSFPAGSLIIPMDPCWQPNTDTDVTSTFQPTGCETSADDRGILQAYGMVYEILRNGANVAWVVNPNKTEENQVDMTVAGVTDADDNLIPPVAKLGRNGINTNIDPGARTLSWTGNDGVDYSENFDAHVIDYRGGPFIVHKKFLNDTILAIVDKFTHVKVHVSNVSFTAPIDKVLDKIPPKIAILGGDNTAILRDYLLAAGLGAAESLVFEEVSPQQIVEDELITPDADGNTFSLFWAPHWVLEDEVGAMTTGGTSITAQEAQLTVMAKLRQFVESGNSAFLECASIESMEGSENGPINLNPGKDIWSAEIESQGGWVTPQLPANWTTATTAGSDDPGARLWVNDGSNDENYIVSDSPTNFLAQCAGWDYKPTGGHVHNYKPHDNVGGSYNANFERFVHDEDGTYGGFDPGFDYYVGGRINGSPTQGYVTYLAGHRYIECNSSGTETTTTTTTTTVAPQSDARFTLTLPSTIPVDSTISFAVYYDSVSAPVTGRVNADGSDAVNGDDATLQVEMQSVSVSGSTLSNLVVSNMSTSAQTINKINVTWSGDAISGVSNTGNGEYVIKKEEETDAKFCDENNTPEGDVCTPDETVTLTLADGLEFKFEILEEIPDDDWLFFDFGYTIAGTPGTANLGMQLDRNGASADKKKLTLDVSPLTDCQTKPADIAFDDGELKVKIEYEDEERTKFKKIKVEKLKLTTPDNTNEPKITSLSLHWGAKDSASCTEPATFGTPDESFNLASTDPDPDYSANGTKGTELTTNISLAANNDGGSDPSGDPIPDLIDVSYCEPKWDKTNTCGTRYVLNTLLGLQFTVISNLYVQSSPIIDRGIAFQGAYEFPTYRGHFQAIKVTGDNFTASDALLWDAAEVMPDAGTGGNPPSLSKDPANRYLFTNNGTTQVEFEVASLSQTTDFLHDQLGKSTLDESKVLLNTVRGRNQATTLLPYGTGEQLYRLWGIRQSSPAVVGKSPLAQAGSAAASRDRIVYAGGDDGMLHAFYAGSYTTDGTYSDGTGKEIWAYIPSLLLPHLQNQNYIDPTKDPVISVSGSPSVRDFLVPVTDSGVLIGAEYRTILICSATIAEQNRGLIFALDVSNPYDPKVLWEVDLSSYNVGDTAGLSLGKMRAGDSIRNWAFLTANYHQPLDADGNVDTSNGSYGINALALDVLTGEIKWQWQEPYATNNVSTTPAIPSLLDIDNNGVVDYMVFGDMDGRVWQLDTNSGHSVLSSGDPVYVVKDADGNPTGAPIGASVALYNNLAVFGTGGTDFASDSAQYGLYALSLGEREATLVWKAESTDVGEKSFLASGEKIWGSPMIDNTGRIYVATGIGYQQQATAPLDDTGTSAGKIHVLDNDGNLLTTVATSSAAVGSLALSDNGAVATDFNGNVVRLGEPTVSGTNQDVKVKVFSWRVR